MSQERIAVRETDIGTKFAGWFGLLHPPFHTVGIFPFVLGTVLAWRMDTSFSIRSLILSTLGVVLVMLVLAQRGLTRLDVHGSNRAILRYHNRTMPRPVG